MPRPSLASSPEPAGGNSNVIFNIKLPSGSTRRRTLLQADVNLDVIRRVVKETGETARDFHFLCLDDAVGTIIVRDENDLHEILDMHASKNSSQAIDLVVEVEQAVDVSELNGSAAAEVVKTPTQMTLTIASAGGDVTNLDAETAGTIKQVENESETQEKNKFECPLCLDEYVLKDMFAIRGDFFCKDCLITDMVTKIRRGQAPTSPSDDKPIMSTLVATVLATRCTLCDVEGMEDIDELVMLDRT